ncbi:MAG TPA: tetratricopeptide repeat protein [Verrucomicrobiae bacterium]|jgi:tetratricopeptide (TPR) repeat protein|nr:tetratricopeptide repeat protein [Verrucomicrobiae bacterium]
MRSTIGKIISSVCALAFVCILSVGALAQRQRDDAYQAQRRQAMQLLDADKHLEALPMFEDLAKRSPQDREVLVGLAVCLVGESATLTDEDTATKERLRARELLLKAKELGDTSTLMENMLQTIPVDGVIKYSSTPADQAMRAGEAAFSRRDFAEAIKNYSKVLELDPKNYSAVLYIGDTYFAQDNFAKASEWYERAIAVDPNVATAYRYYSDMLIKHGEMEKARTRAIQSVVAEPYNPITWRSLRYWAQANKVQLIRVQIDVPNNVSQKDDKNITINVDPNAPEETSAVWLSYGLFKAGWRGDKFKKEFPNEKQYRHSLAEEAGALAFAATVWTESDASKNQKPSSGPKDPSLVTLLKLNHAKMIEPYVLLIAADDGIAQDYAGYRETNRAKLEDFLDQFVVPPAPSKASARE